MSEHTKEPWVWSGRDHDGFGLLAGKNGAAICEADISEANARRIVACVNTCAALSTGVLEKHIGKGVFEILTEMTAQRDRLLSLAKQAGKELAAVAEDLKKCSTLDGDWGDELEAKEEYDRLMALAAELEGGAA